jgi:cytoskeletal protein CcmA (bactofilin family)
MFFKRTNKIQNNIDTLVSAETRIEGNIHFSGGLRVDGTVVGNLTEPNGSQSTLILGEKGRIEGAVNASKVVLIGKVVGPVTAAVFIELQSTAHITGDVYYKSLEMHTGAVIEGKLVYLGDGAQLVES